MVKVDDLSNKIPQGTLLTRTDGYNKLIPCINIKGWVGHSVAQNLAPSFDRRSKKNDDIIARGINFHFIAVAMLNSLWLFLWISYVYWNLKTYHPAKSLLQTIFIHAPFSLYHAWILIIAILTIYATFTPDRPIAYPAAIETVNDEVINETATVYYESPSIFVQILVILGLLFMECTAIGYIEKFKGDLAGAAVIAWTLYGVWSEQQDAIIRWTAFALAVVTTIHILKPLTLSLLSTFLILLVLIPSLFAYSIPNSKYNKRNNRRGLNNNVRDNDFRSISKKKRYAGPNINKLHRARFSRRCISPIAETAMLGGPCGPCDSCGGFDVCDDVPLLGPACSNDFESAFESGHELQCCDESCGQTCCEGCNECDFNMIL
ncbi:14524_t:CDS:2 [Dentiscutata erythropus]|uniref:14524_t:CDS:1 n=1 Tax=Dentiscutata erythropus TaxID=1348616 RepID=A0A9N8YW70_9GLOM|nr:14524_t:CDS:2 [Dentiscutata erythropus]